MKRLISSDTLVRVSPCSCCASGRAVRSASACRAFVRCSRAAFASTWPVVPAADRDVVPVALWAVVDDGVPAVDWLELVGVDVELLGVEVLELLELVVDGVEVEGAVEGVVGVVLVPEVPVVVPVVVLDWLMAPLAALPLAAAANCVMCVRSCCSFSRTSPSSASAAPRLAPVADPLVPVVSVSVVLVPVDPAALLDPSRSVKARSSAMRCVFQFLFALLLPARPDALLAPAAGVSSAL